MLECSTMLELSDVEGQRRTLARHGEGRRITAVRIFSPDLVRNTSPQGLGRALHERISNRHGRIARREDWISSERGHRDPRCPRCRSPIRRSTIARRTSYWCPRCQRTR